MTASIGSAAQRLPAWLTKNVPGLIVTAVISAVVGYVVNVWLMAVRYEGSVTTKGAPAMSKDNVIAGGLFWAMFPMVVCSVIGYRRAVGRERFWRDVRRLPVTLVGLFRRDGSQGWVHLLWGAAIALAATLFVPPAVGAVLGAGLLIGAPTIVGSVLSSAFAQLWRMVGRVVAPTKDHRVAPVLKVAVGILGWAVALVIGFVLPGEWIRLVLALGCGAAAFLIGRRASSLAIGATAAVVVVVGAVVADVLSALPVLADDGGFAECGSTLEGWIRSCSGAGEVRRRALLGAFVAAPGGAFGFVGGGVIGLISGQARGGAWWDRLGLEELPRGPIDPSTGESLVVNDGRWTDVPVGHVYFEGQWAHPESVGALPGELEDPFTPDPDEEESSLHPELWVPPLIAAAISGIGSASQGSTGAGGRRTSARSARRAAAAAGAAGADETTLLDLPIGADADATRLAAFSDADPATARNRDAAAAATPGTDAADAATRAAGEATAPGAEATRAGDAATPAAGDATARGVDAAAPEPETAEGRALVAEADGLRRELAAAPTEDERVRLQSALRAKAVEIARHGAARTTVAAADPTEGLAEALARELEARDTEVMGVFVERMTEMGVTRGGKPIDATDVAELRQRAHPTSDVAPSNMRQLWKGYGSKKGKFAIDAATYLRFLEDRRDDAGATAERTPEDQAKLDRKIDRLRAAIDDDGVTTVMVSEQIWNEVAQFAYAQAVGETT